ncbi:hypothetical protein WA026_002835 [Henosepilachna vigintioctopunctata]|uniref:Uncharacterized protein n=1 Tax=Henosepilachna vigintioctopunctata TaxID=420089 RepID=A0AAW1U2H5_9CUCU
MRFSEFVVNVCGKKWPFGRLIPERDRWPWLRPVASPSFEVAESAGTSRDNASWAEGRTPPRPRNSATRDRKMPLSLRGTETIQKHLD